MHLSEENGTLPQTTMAEASKAPPGRRGLCVTLPHNITSPHNSSIQTETITKLPIIRFIQKMKWTYYPGVQAEYAGR